MSVYVHVYRNVSCVYSIFTLCMMMSARSASYCASVIYILMILLLMLRIHFAKVETVVSIAFDYLKIEFLKKTL